MREREREGRGDHCRVKKLEQSLWGKNRQEIRNKGERKKKSNKGENARKWGTDEMSS